MWSWLEAKVMKVMKVAKAMKAMQAKATKVMQVSKIAKGKLARASVLKGHNEETACGLKKSAS